MVNILSFAQFAWSSFFFNSFKCCPDCVIVGHSADNNLPVFDF